VKFLQQIYNIGARFTPRFQMLTQISGSGLQAPGVAGTGWRHNGFLGLMIGVAARGLLRSCALACHGLLFGLLFRLWAGSLSVRTTR